MMNFKVLQRNELPHDGQVFEFEGIHYQVDKVSFIWVDMPPGGTVRLHKHPYEEIFIVQEGMATFTIGGSPLEAHAGQLIIVPANVAHKFMNVSEGPLKQIDIHIHGQFITEWLDEEEAQ